MRRDCSAHFADWDRDFFRADGLGRLSALVAERLAELPAVAEGERWGAPVARPGKVLCIGRNYSDHAAQSGMEVPPEPVVFMKAANTVVGPFDDVRIPREFLVMPGGPAYKMLIERIVTGGNTAVGTLALGVARAAYEEGPAYAKDRVQGDQVIFDHQVIKMKLFNAFRQL